MVDDDREYSEAEIWLSNWEPQEICPIGIHNPIPEYCVDCATGCCPNSPWFCDD